MSFSTHWLELREPLDLTARNQEILQRTVDYFKTAQGECITDIACGTGSTMRAMTPYLPGNTKWRFIDNDPRLLKAAEQITANENASFHHVDLSTNLEALFKMPTSMITTSAFLDLVSQEWLEQFISKLGQYKLPLYAALSYDGRVACTPKRPEDEEIIQAHDQHQQTDKGFGIGLGKSAIEHSIALLEKQDYQVITGTSDWHDDGKHIVFQQHLFEGWCNAACEINPQRSDVYQQWLTKRFSILQEGQARLQVGHIDIFAIPKR